MLRYFPCSVYLGTDGSQKRVPFFQSSICFFLLLFVLNSEHRSLLCIFSCPLNCFLMKSRILRMGKGDPSSHGITTLLYSMVLKLADFSGKGGFMHNHRLDDTLWWYFRSIMWRKLHSTAKIKNSNIKVFTDYNILWKTPKGWGFSTVPAQVCLLDRSWAVSCSLRPSGLPRLLTQWLLAPRT